MNPAISMWFAAAAPHAADNTDCLYTTDNTRPPLSLHKLGFYSFIKAFYQHRFPTGISFLHAGLASSFENLAATPKLQPGAQSTVSFKLPQHSAAAIILCFVGCDTLLPCALPQLHSSAMGVTHILRKSLRKVACGCTSTPAFSSELALNPHHTSVKSYPCCHTEPDHKSSGQYWSTALT